MLGSCSKDSTSQEQIKNIIEGNSQRSGRSGNAACTICRKKLHASGCFDCDKVITVLRFSPFEPSKSQ
jgi:hypothetical protein